MSVRDTIASYVEEISNERVSDHSSNLFESGLLTSLDVLSLVAFIEGTFMLEISGDDVDMDSFGTIDGLVTMITTMQSHHHDDANVSHDDANVSRIRNVADP